MQNNILEQAKLAEQRADNMEGAAQIKRQSMWGRPSKRWNVVLGLHIFRNLAEKKNIAAINR